LFIYFFFFKNSSTLNFKTFNFFSPLQEMKNSDIIIKLFFSVIFPFELEARGHSSRTCLIIPRSRDLIPLLGNEWWKCNILYCLSIVVPCLVISITEPTLADPISAHKLASGVTNVLAFLFKMVNYNLKSFMAMNAKVVRHKVHLSHHRARDIFYRTNYERNLQR
jgi:hypothetical protein